MRIEVDSGGYASAVDAFYNANHGVVDAVTRLSGVLGGSGSMAGTLPRAGPAPSDVGAAYHRYEVLRPLPDAQEGLAPAWFEQPGGGAMVVLARPVRWYVDQGLLVELVDPA